jgi:hypothetical protein
MTTYAGWWQMPTHLPPATALGELEYPRTANGRQPAAVRAVLAGHHERG